MKLVIEVRDDAEEWEIDYLEEAIDQCDATWRVIRLTD